MSEIKHTLIKQRRIELGLGVEEMAKEVGLTRQQLTRIEKGLNNPRLPRLRAICKRLGIPLADVLRTESILSQMEQIA